MLSYACVISFDYDCKPAKSRTLKLNFQNFQKFCKTHFKFTMDPTKHLIMVNTRSIHFETSDYVYESCTHLNTSNIKLHLKSFDH